MFFFFFCGDLVCFFFWGGEGFLFFCLFVLFLLVLLGLVEKGSYVLCLC